MRPLRLEMEGFTCFREKQVVDFQDLGLFAISGPTGAGKSSLLDAMVYALYGQIPRVGKQGVSEFISLGRDRMAVTFDFEVGSRRYRVARVGYRANRGTKAQLDSMDTKQSIVGGVTGVADEIERILGLTAETFQQSVLLPQGQFSRFLKARPGEQRIILRHLLRLGIYETLRKAAGEQASRTEAEAQGLRKRLDEDYSGISEQALQQLVERHQRLVGELAADSAAFETRREAFVRLSERGKAWEEVRRWAARLAALNEQQATVVAEDGQLQAALRAAPVAPWVSAAEEAQRHLEQATRILDAKRAAEASAAASAEGAAKVLSVAETAALMIPDLEAQIQRLEGAVALLPERTATSKRIEDERQRIQTAETHTRTHQAAVQRERAQAEKLSGQLTELEGTIQRLGYDPALHDRLRDLQKQGGRLISTRKAVNAARTEAQRTTEQRRTAELALATADQQLRTASEALNEATRQREHAQRERQEAEYRHQAHILRETLVPGSPCPVCDQPVESLPDPGLPPELDALRACEGRTEEARQRAAQQHEHSSGLRVRRETELTAARAAENLALGTLHQRLQELEEEEADLTARAALPAGAEPIEVRLEMALKVSGAQAAQHQTLCTKKAQLLTESQQAELNATKAESQLAVAQEALHRAQLQLEAAIQSLADLERRIREVTEATDPKAEQQKLRLQVKELSSARDRAREEDSQRKHTLATARAELASAVDAQKQAAERLATSRQKAEQEVLAAGFVSAAAAKLALLPSAEVERLKQRVSSWQSERQQADARHAAALERAGEMEVTQEQVKREEAALEQASQRLAEQRKQVGGMEAEVVAARQKLEMAVRLEGEWKKHRSEQSLYEQLAKDLRTDAFEKWLLDGTFRALVEGASVRLLSMSGRYTLDYRDDEFWVVDHDNARDQRKADTLSGGEMFLASLCLALQLSEQVQRASGAVRLDSLFIDEGFGTLDPETLDTVAEALEMLGAGNRMVGIVTHVPELTERLSARLVVKKGGAGSSVAAVVS